MEQEKICSNCRYARQHYAINPSGFFAKLNGVMDCTNRKVTKIKFKKCFKEKNYCERWESNELKKQENEQKIIYWLKYASNRLEKVIEVLESIAMNEKE